MEGGSPDMCALVISVPGRDPITNTRTSGSVPGAGVVSVFYPVRGFNYWDLENEYLPHEGPFHYVLDDTVYSPGYWVDPDCSPDPCEWWISLSLPVPTRTARFYGGFPGAAVGNAAGAEDFSADGLADILIGSPLSKEGAGAAFLILGRLPPLVIGSELPLEEIGLPMESGSAQTSRVFDGIRVVGAPGSRLGQSQDSAGDFNNDGIADVVIGSPLVNRRRGGAAVFFGSRDVINLTQEEIPFDEIPTRGLGVIFEGEREGDLAGARVAGVRDVDGDGNDDLLIAAPNASVQLDIDRDGTIEIDRTNCGVVYLIYGTPELGGKRLSLGDVGTEDLPGAVFIGRNSGDFLGAGLGEHGDRSYGIAGAGDIDGDGHADVLLGSVRASPRDRLRAGEVYLLYGVGD